MSSGVGGRKRRKTDVEDEREEKVTVKFTECQDVTGRAQLPGESRRKV